MSSILNGHILSCGGGYPSQGLSSFKKPGWIRLLKRAHSDFCARSKLSAASFVVSYDVEMFGDEKHTRDQKHHLQRAVLGCVCRGRKRMKINLLSLLCCFVDNLSVKMCSVWAISSEMSVLMTVELHSLLRQPLHRLDDPLFNLL